MGVSIPTVPQPFLIVVTGRPGAGKSTLAHLVARSVRCPAICRDEIKEGWVHTSGDVGTLGGEAARHVYGTFFDTLELLLGRGVSVVAEAAFQHGPWAARLEPLLAVARVRVIVCDAGPDIAAARRIDRHRADPHRARFHPDPAVLAAIDGREPLACDYDPPRLAAPTLTVDTSAGYRPPLDDVIAFARG